MSNENRDEKGKFASDAGGKTQYSHTTASTNVSLLKTKTEEIKQKAFEHADYLRKLGHEPVKVTSMYTAHTIPGGGIGGTKSFFVYHGNPKDKK
jgi:hypothetical protein